tara:strand:+ start:61 stop:1650 length:1590 start_codon:yes stop_codon:yes gene_type:complete
MELDYNTRLAAIQRNEKLAQIMQQQAFKPIDIQSYNGIQAPISPLSGLAKVLQAYMGAKGSGDEDRIKLNQEAKVQAQQMLSGLQDRPASPGRAAVMGMPEVQAQPATSFAPMGADFEDNPNLQTAPSGNVETPAVAFQPAVAPQAAIAPQAAQQLTQDQKRQKYVEIMMGQNPYASPIAKLEYERLGKQDSGPLAEYNLYAQQTRAAGGTPIGIDEYKTRQKIAGATRVTNNIPSSMQPMWVRNKTTKQMQWVQADNRGSMDLSNYEQAGTTDVEKLIEARNRLPGNSLDRKVLDAMITQMGTKAYGAGATVERPTGTSQTAGQPAPATTNMMIDGKLTAVPIAQASELNAKFQGAQTAATEGAKAELDLVPVSKDGKDILMPRATVIKQANEGNPALAKPDVKETQGRAVIELAEKARKILPRATSGFISQLATMATDAAGIATDKSGADAQLRVIAGALTSNVPRMEGPQSDADIVLYKQSAGDVANPNIPYKTRINALKIIVDLNEKYSTTPVAPPAGSVRRITP